MKAIPTLQTRFGNWGLEADENGITALIWNAEPSNAEFSGKTPDILTEGFRQLQAYAEGRLQVFDLPLAPKGSEFQQKVFAAMQAIPFGKTITYGDIAKSLNCPAQPVGQACGANPIPIIIPCHRVLAKTGIGGFSGWGGVENKIALLKHENGFPFLI